MLVGRWVHAHEEDDSLNRVFVRAGTPLPPSRGRVEFEILPDLSARRFGPGADDRAAMTGGYRVVLGGAAGPPGNHELVITAARDGRLWIAKG
jgi:hypothetical protein